jgi:ribosomal protein S18 acetylase RimI-like enzyme
VISYRTAGPADADAIAFVHVETWKLAYRGQVPDDYLDGLSVDERAGRWRQLFAETSPPAEVLVAEEDAVVGFASIVASRDEDAGAATGEVAAVYLLPTHWDRGIGRELLLLAVGRLAAAGFETATLWVLASNARARRFYEAAGWSPDGTEQLTRIGGVDLPELRYRTLLANERTTPPSVTSRG